mmetsp:Transcript_102372/g.181787  ORF Transcript_102372/g.181787 Transcript_102372/m.181787 type:complete len:282 (+) Transcript_102372:69-914(+)
MAPPQPGQGYVQRRTKPRTALGLLAVIGALAAPLAFLPGISIPTNQDAVHTSVDTSRRNILKAAAAAAAVSMQAPVQAKEAPERIQITGAFGRRGPKINGVWNIVPEKQVNSRAVYKKDNYYLMFNDCEQFQMNEIITGECTGFAKEKDGKWFIEGKENQMTLKPLKKENVQASGDKAYEKSFLPSVFGFGPAPPPPGSAPPAPSKGDESSPGFQLPFQGKASDNPDDLLFDSRRDVTAYTRAKSGGGGMSQLIEAYMKMEDDEKEIANSLEARLAGKKVR